jgi:type II secretory pathway component PulK
MSTPTRTTIDHEVTARILMNWAARRAEEVADQQLRRDLHRYFDDVGHRWHRRGSDAAIAGGFVIGTALVVVAAVREALRHSS